MLFLIEILLAIGLLALLIVSWFVGKLLGRRMHSQIAEHPQLGMLQGAILALLGLLLGFSFAGAVSRFVERQDILVREANAITTLYDRTELLDAPNRDAVQPPLREYMAARRRLFALSGVRDERPALEELSRIQRQTWAALGEAIRARPEFAETLAPAFADVADTLSLRNASESRHVPGLVLLVLVCCALASIASVGLGVETSDKRLRIPAMVLVFLIAATLWTIIDLDFPRVGLIRLNPQPLADAARHLEPALAPPAR